MIPLQLMIGQLTGEPNPHKPDENSRCRRISRVAISSALDEEFSDRSKRADDRLLAFIAGWDKYTAPEGFTVDAITRESGCSSQVASRVVDRLYMQGVLQIIGKTKARKAEIFGVVNGQIQSAA